MNAFFKYIERSPGSAFSLFLLIHVMIWTVLPAWLYPNLPLDLIEALTYGREWQLGYDKLPPLPWWIIEGVHRFFGRDVFYYLVAQTAVITAFIAVWLTARRLVGGLGALLALLILDGTHYVHFTAAKFNHDVIQLPFWALAGYAFHSALRRERLLHWALLGFSIGLAWWAKYFVIVLVVPLILFMLIDARARKQFAKPGPYLAVVIALVMAAPHLIWLVQNDFLPFRYADARATPSRGLIDHVWHPLQFVIGQLAFMLTALFVALPLFVPRAERAPSNSDDYDFRIITLLTFGPAATVVLMSLVTGRGTIAMWGYPLWLFLGLWIMLLAPALTRMRLQLVVAMWAVIFFGFAIAFYVTYAILPKYDGRYRAVFSSVLGDRLGAKLEASLMRYRAVFFPGDRLGAEMSARFRVLTGNRLAYVVGDMWTGGNIGHYAPEQPRVLIDGSPRRAPWIDLGDLRARGAIVVWTDGDLRMLPVAFRTVALDAEIQEPFSLPYRNGWGPAGGVQIGWAVLRPQPAVAGLN